MPTATRSLTRATRERAKARGINYTQAREELVWIKTMLDDGEFETFAEADEFVRDERNHVMCRICGWTYGMVCPECPGCGCYNGRCSGWRHREMMDAEELAELDYQECEDCGGDVTNPYDCVCHDG